MVKMIAVWGSNASGKSVISNAIATKLASKGRNVIIISADTSVPALPVYLPKKHFDNFNSLGQLLSNPVTKLDDLGGYIHIHPQSDRIGIMGLVSAENTISYSAFEHERVKSLLQMLDETPFNYVIFDCCSNPVHDTVTMLALQFSDATIRTITADVKGLEYEKSQLSWLSKNMGVNTEKHIRIINPVFENSPAEALVSVTGQVDFILPYSHDLSNKFIAGELIKNMSDRTGIDFENKITVLTERILLNEQ